MNSRRALLSLTAALTLTAALPGLAQRPGPPLPEGVEVVRDVEYGMGGGRALRMHLVRPRQRPEKEMPVLVWVHGGAWLSGSRDSGIPRLAPFAARGYFGATVEYRLSQEARFPAQIEDCKAAVRFLRARASEYGLDAERIGVMGSSAGGHLAALLGTSGGVKELEGSGGNAEQSSRVQAVLDLFGPTDFLQMSKFPSRIDHDSLEAPEAKLIGGPVQENREKAARANPITYVTKDDPPFLLIHGDQDPLVPHNQSELLHEALGKAGVSSRLHVIRGGGHGEPGFEAPEVRAMVTEFFDRHLRR